MITMLNCDCMEFMRTLPDKAYDLAIVDPPYGILNLEEGKTSAIRKSPRSSGSGKLKNRIMNNSKFEWDSAPDAKYFDELFRVSKNQIIWGGNYFDLPSSRCVVCWDKEQPWENFSQWEMAWTSFNRPASLFRLNNALGSPGKIHPTQKPVALYKWLLSRYAKPGDKILDTHGGSGSICIACHDLGFDLTWMELDAGYFAAASKRYKNHSAQAELFPVEKESTNFISQVDLFA